MKKEPKIEVKEVESTPIQTIPVKARKTRTPRPVAPAIAAAKAEAAAIVAKAKLKAKAAECAAKMTEDEEYAILEAIREKQCAREHPLHDSATV